MRDIPGMMELINGYASDGIMLPRTEFEMVECIRDFTVVNESEKILACGALHFYTTNTGEVRSVAVSSNSTRAGVGRKLVEALEQEARECELHTLFLFTYVPEFFRKLGYCNVDRSELPLKAWKDCMRCPRFQCCDELAMIKYLDGRAMPSGIADIQDPEVASIQLPVLKH